MNMDQNTKQWLEFRRKGIGASDANVIMGVNPYKSLLDLYEEKMGKETEDNQAMRHGKTQEALALIEFTHITGILMKPKVCISKHKPWAFASLDGMSINGDNIVEIKCPYSESSFEKNKDGIPRIYYPQVQHQLFVTDLPSAYYCAFFWKDGEMKFYLHIVERDDDYIQDMIEREEKFYEEHMQKQVPPRDSKAPINKDEDLLWVLTAKRLYELDMQVKELEREKNRTRDMLISLSNGHSCVAENLRLSKVSCKGRVDLETIPELKGVDLDKYRGDNIITWKFTY